MLFWCRITSPPISGFHLVTTVTPPYRSGPLSGNETQESNLYLAILEVIEMMWCFYHGVFILFSFSRMDAWIS